MSRTGAGRPYVDRPVGSGDVAAADVLAASTARRLGLGEPRLARLGMNAIYVAGENVVRVGRPTAPASSSLVLAERLAAAGLRVARPASDEVVEDGDLVATVWERLVPSGQPIDWGAVGAMVRVVNELPVDVVPCEYPLPSPASFPWWDFDALLAETAPALDDAARRGLAATIDRWPDWRQFGDVVLCHGDIHPGNVVMIADGPVLIDWDLLCRAPRGWDHAPLMTWTARWGGAPGIYESYAAGYGWSARGDAIVEAFAELRLVAATLMRIRAVMAFDPADTSNPPDPRPEAERRLRYWRGEPDAPTWRAQ